MSSLRDYGIARDRANYNHNTPKGVKYTCAIPYYNNYYFFWLWPVQLRG